MQSLSKSLQCASVALQSFGQAREFRILKLEVSEKLPRITELWQEVNVQGCVLCKVCESRNLSRQCYLSVLVV